MNQYYLKKVSLYKKTRKLEKLSIVNSFILVFQILRTFGKLKKKNQRDTMIIFCLRKGTAKYKQHRPRN